MKLLKTIKNIRDEADICYRLCPCCKETEAMHNVAGRGGLVLGGIMLESSNIYSENVTKELFREDFYYCYSCKTNFSTPTYPLGVKEIEDENKENK